MWYYLEVDESELFLAKQTNGIGKHNISNSLFFLF